MNSDGGINLSIGVGMEWHANLSSVGGSSLLISNR